ncbi:hypothetical protein ACFLU3_02600 [Chloroflexota bacterium]
MSSMQEFSQIAKSVNNPYIDEWMASGKKVVGFLCSHVPEEIIYAAGILLFRLRAPDCTITFNKYGLWFQYLFEN